MSKILKIGLLVLPFCVVLFFADSAKAQTTIPTGSYLQSCHTPSVEGNALKAYCKPKEKGKLLDKPDTKLYDFFLCEGDIYNNDSVLECNKSGKSPLMLKAKTAVKTAYKMFFGRDTTDSVNPWMRVFFKDNKYASTFFYNGLQPGIIGQSMQKFLREPEQGKYRLTIINNAFADVYGKEPSSTDVAFWNSEMTKGKGLYGNIFKNEAKKLNSNKINRRFMITAAYKKSFGRAALGKELDYWEKKSEVFSEIVQACRNFMYSSNGAKDLSETVERSFTKKGNKPTTKQINEAIIKYTKTKAIYSEMQ